MIFPLEFPEAPNDPFYQQFNDPMRAYSNIQGLYNSQLCYRSFDDCIGQPQELDHLIYAIVAAEMDWTELHPKAEALKIWKVMKK